MVHQRHEPPGAPLGLQSLLVWNDFSSGVKTFDLVPCEGNGAGKKKGNS